MIQAEKVDKLLQAIEQYLNGFSVDQPGKGLAELTRVWAKIKASQDEEDRFLGRPL